jgi:hypothetical protein
MDSGGFRTGVESNSDVFFFHVPCASQSISHAAPMSRSTADQSRRASRLQRDLEASQRSEEEERRRADALQEQVYELTGLLAQSQANYDALVRSCRLGMAAVRVCRQGVPLNASPAPAPAARLWRRRPRLATWCGLAGFLRARLAAVVASGRRCDALGVGCSPRRQSLGQLRVSAARGARCVRRSARSHQRRIHAGQPGADSLSAAALGGRGGASRPPLGCLERGRPALSALNTCALQRRPRESAELERRRWCASISQPALSLFLYLTYPHPTQTLPTPHPWTLAPHPPPCCGRAPTSGPAWRMPAERARSSLCRPPG